MTTLLKEKISDFIIDTLMQKKIFRILSDKQIVFIDYYAKFGKPPNLQRPRSFSEKIQWIKLYGNLNKYSKYVDKYEVRKFVRKTVGTKYLIPLYGVWDKFEEIDFNKLPNKFVLKATHGSAYNFICKDKSKLNLTKLGKTANGWLSENFYKKTREIQYDPCKPKIICEKYLEDESGGLIDYKILCKNGNPKIVECHKDRFTDHKVVSMDLNWKRLPINVIPNHHNLKKAIKKPNNFEEMNIIARKLSKRFPFVRVDLYSVDDKIYFSELTFTPANGLLVFDSKETDSWLGELIDISKY